MARTDCEHIAFSVQFHLLRRQAWRDHRQRIEPIAGQRGRRWQIEPARGVTDGAQHLGCAAKVAESVDSHRPSLTEPSIFAA